MIPRKNTHNLLPSEYRQKLPFGIHEQQLIAGKNIIDRIPTAKRNLVNLMARNSDLGLLILSKVHKEYHRTKHYEAKDAEKMERYHQIAAKDVTRLVGRGFIAERVLRDIKLGVNPELVDAILKRKVIKVSEAKKLASKIAELEQLDRGRARDARSRLSSMLSAPLSNAEEKAGMTPYDRVMGYIERQIEFAKEKHK